MPFQLWDVLLVFLNWKIPSYLSEYMSCVPSPLKISQILTMPRALSLYAARATHLHTDMQKATELHMI